MLFKLYIWQNSDKCYSTAAGNEKNNMGQIRGKYPREMKLEVCKFGSQFYHNDNYVNKR